MSLNDQAVLTAALGYIFVAPTGTAAPSPSDIKTLDPLTFGAKTTFAFKVTGAPTGGTFTVSAGGTASAPPAGREASRRRGEIPMPGSTRRWSADAPKIASPCELPGRPRDGCLPARGLAELTFARRMFPGAVPHSRRKLKLASSPSGACADETQFVWLDIFLTGEAARR